MDGGTMVVVTRKREKSMKLLQYVLKNLPPMESDVSIIFVRSVITSIKNNNGDVPFSKATESEISVALDKDQHAAYEMCEFLKEFCRNHKVNARVIPIQTTTKGRDIVDKINELKSRVVYMLGPSKKGLKWKIAKGWKTAGYVKTNAPSSCTVRIISDFSKGKTSESRSSTTASDTAGSDSASWSTSDITESRTCSTSDVTIRSSLSRQSVLSTELSHEQVQQGEEIFSLEDWLNHKGRNMQWEEIVNILLDIANEITTIKLSEDVTHHTVLVRSGHLFRFESLIEGQTVEQVLVSSPDILHFGMLIFELLSRRPDRSGNLVKEFDEAFKERNMWSLVDVNAGWPIEIVESLTSLGLRCVEGRVGSVSFYEVVVPELRELWRDAQHPDILAFYVSLFQQS